MSKLRDAAQQALEALEWADNAMYEGTPIQVNTQKAITALRTALAEQPAEQQPVAWEWRWFDTSPYTVTSGQWSEWKRVEPRNSLCTLDDALNEFRAYIANGLRYELRAIYTAPQPAIPPGYKLVPEVPTNEWINNLAKTQTGPLEDVPFADIYQCIAELLDTAPEAPQPAKREPLTDEDIDQVTDTQWASNNHKPIYAAHRAYARAIERAHGIGGQP